jgi:hypothetical protein
VLLLRRQGHNASEIGLMTDSGVIHTITRDAVTASSLAGSIFEHVPYYRSDGAYCDLDGNEVVFYRKLDRLRLRIKGTDISWGDIRKVRFERWEKRRFFGPKKMTTLGIDVAGDVGLLEILYEDRRSYVDFDIGPGFMDYGIEYEDFDLGLLIAKAFKYPIEASRLYQPDWTEKERSLIERVGADICGRGDG